MPWALFREQEDAQGYDDRRPRPRPRTDSPAYNIPSEEQFTVAMGQSHQPHPSIVAFDHVGLAVRTFESALPLYRDALGGVEIGRGAAPRLGLNWLQLRYPNGSVLGLIEPLGADSPLHRGLQQRGEGVHHLTFISSDAQGSAEMLKERGYLVVEEDYAHLSWRVAHLSPRSANGTVVQIAQGAEQVPPRTAIPDALRARALEVLEQASETDRPSFRRFAAMLELLEDEPGA